MSISKLGHDIRVMSKLVHDLRFMPQCVAIGPWRQVTDDAANRIEALEAVVEAVKKAHICDGDFQDDDGTLRGALAKLDGS